MKCPTTPEPCWGRGSGKWLFQYQEYPEWWNDYFDILSDDIFIDELHGGTISPSISFDIKINNGVPIGIIEAQLNITATVYQENIGDFDYDDTDSM